MPSAARRRRAHAAADPGGAGVAHEQFLVRPCSLPHHHHRLAVCGPLFRRLELLSQRVRRGGHPVARPRSPRRRRRQLAFASRHRLCASRTVRIADTSITLQEPFFRADSLTFKLSIPPLIRGIIEANEVECRRPVLRLAGDVAAPGTGKRRRQFPEPERGVADGAIGRQHQLGDRRIPRPGGTPPRPARARGQSACSSARNPTARRRRQIAPGCSGSPGTTPSRANTRVPFPAPRIPSSRAAARRRSRTASILSASAPGFPATARADAARRGKLDGFRIGKLPQRLFAGLLQGLDRLPNDRRFGVAVFRGAPPMQREQRG